MVLIHKFKRAPSSPTPTERGEYVIKTVPLEEDQPVKKKSQRQVESEKMDEFVKGVQEKHDAREERMKELLAKLPF